MLDLDLAACRLNGLNDSLDREDLLFRWGRRDALRLRGPPAGELQSQEREQNQ